MKMLHLSIAAITIKIFTEGFHDQQENFTRISGKGKQRTKSEEEVCIRFKSGKGNGKKKHGKVRNFFFNMCLTTN